jgi:transcriptional regulator with PAS, ATPase and Fis domain
MALARAPRAEQSLPDEFARDAATIRHRAMQSLFERLSNLCEGAIAVDAQARVVWINDKYLVTLGLASAEQALGKEVEEVIPNSLMRRVIETGEPILLDIMGFGNQSLVVTRMPLEDEAGRIIGAIGFVLYDRLDYLKPLVSKFAQLHSELAAAQRKLVEERRPRYTLADYVGASPAVMEAKRLAKRAAQQDSTVLLIGETGTGKELMAQAIHGASGRAKASFVAVNVAAVPETLLEAEFFGTAPGAYTGADRKGRDGKFRIADGGTLFLDEVGDMPLQLQAKLLRALQEHEIEPLGSNKVAPVDVRVIAATNADLPALVKQGRFRADLYYRLNVLSIRLPPLRENLADLEPLSAAMLKQIATRSGAPVRSVTPTGLAALAGYDWPGNVRELRNVLEHATMLTDNFRLTAEDFAKILPVAPAETPQATAIRPWAEAIEACERKLIADALVAANGKAGEAARLLGMSRANFYKKMARHGFEP